jgi:hypothetical protein
MNLPRVSLLPHRNAWSEIEADAVRVLECYVAWRGRCRPGDVLEVPLTIGHVQFWLRRTGARRCGRDYARRVLAALVEMGLLRDTGHALTPRVQPKRPGRSCWWRVWLVVPLARVVRLGTYPLRSAAASVSLCRFLRGQGFLAGPKRRRRFARGSVQANFWATGPP